MKKILYLYPKFNPITGGGTVHGFYNAKYLSKYYDLYTLKNNSVDFAYFIKFPKFIYMLLTFKFDLVYLRISNGGFSFLYMLLKPFVKKIIVEVNAPSNEVIPQNKLIPSENVINTINKFIFKISDSIICVSQEVKNYVDSIGHFDTNVVNNGGERFELKTDDVDKFFYRGVELNNGYLLWVGNNYPWQDFDSIIDLAKSNPEYKVVIITDRFVDKLKKQNNIIQFNNVDRNDIPLFVKNASFGIAFYKKMNSEWGFYNSPLKIYEYAVNGLKSITNVKNFEINQLIDDGYVEFIADDWSLQNVQSVIPKYDRTWFCVASEIHYIIEGLISEEC